MEGYKEDLKNAMKTSSLKGLPKIFSAPNLFHRILWAIAFIFFLIICLCTVSSNVAAYLEYPKVVTVEEKLMSHAYPNETVPFPTIAVCNLNQFGSNKSLFEENGIPLPGDYYRKVHEMTECEGCPVAIQNFGQYLKRKLMNNRGYYQFVGKEAMAKIGDHHFVLICQATVAHASSLVAFPCENDTKSYTFVHPDFGVCTAYEVQLKHDRMVIGYTFTLHLDSSVDNLNTEFEPLLSPQPSSGAAFIALDPYITPNEYAETARAGPGKATTVLMKIIRTDRLSKPYSDRECIDGDENEKYIFQGQEYNYDYATCIGRCSMAVCERECNCTDFFMIRNPEDGPPNYKYCGSVNQSASDLYTNMYCSELTKATAFYECNDVCKEPCKEIKYVLRAATTKWPLPSQIASFYTNVIQKDPILYDKYRQYEDVAKGMASGSKNVSDMDKLLISKAIEDNFALVSIQLSGFYYTHYESEKKTTLDAFISQLGGSLNLWSGITVVLAVEIIDLVLRILGRLLTGTKKTARVIKVTPVQEKGNGEMY